LEVVDGGGFVELLIIPGDEGDKDYDVCVVEVGIIKSKLVIFG
jgi:hypothetical protein